MYYLITNFSIVENSVIRTVIGYVSDEAVANDVNDRTNGLNAFRLFINNGGQPMDFSSYQFYGSESYCNFIPEGLEEVVI